MILSLIGPIVRTEVTAAPGQTPQGPMTLGAKSNWNWEVNSTRRNDRGI